MKKIGLLLIGLFFLLESGYAYSECARSVNRIFTYFGTTPGEWVSFQDGGSSIYQNESLLTDAQLGRFLSTVLTAQTTGKKLLVRYQEDGLPCPPTGSARSDVLGIWLMNE